MFDFLKKRKRDDENRVDNNIITGASGLTASNSAQQSTAEAAKTFRKPETYKGNRKLYDNDSAKINAKKNAFSNGKVTDPYTEKNLELRKADAKLKYGNKWDEHLAEADHITPIKKIYNDNKRNPWLSNDDIKTIANSEDNLEVVSRKINNAKRERTNEEFFSDDEYLKSECINLSEEAKQRGIERGKEAQRIIDRKERLTTAKNIIHTGHEAGKTAAKSSGQMAAAMSSINNIVAVINGEKDTAEALADTAKDTGKAVVTSYAMGNGLTTVSHTLSASNSEFLQALSKSNIPGKVITAVMMTGNTLKKFADGEITTNECILELGESGLNFATMGYSMAAGQALIPIPVVGAAVGALVGSVATSKLYHELIDKLKVKQLEHEERMRIFAESEAVAEQCRAFRKELEEYIENYFSDYQHCFDSALDTIKSAFYSGDANGVIAGANQITQKLGGQVKYNTVEEFEQFLMDDSIDII